MRHKLVAKKLIHLLKRLSFRLREEEPVAKECNDVEDKKYVEVLELDRSKCQGGELGEDQVDCPVGECGNSVTQGANFNGENLIGCISVCTRLDLLSLHTSAGYTQEMIPSGV